MKRNKCIFISLCFLIGVCLTTLAGCGVAPQSQINPSETLTPSSSPTQQLPTYTLLPTHTSTPPQISPTAISKPTYAPPILTLAPTLATQGESALVKELLRTNGGCELPCFWGLTPGETTWDTADQFFRLLDKPAELSLNQDYYRVLFEIPENNIEVFLAFHKTKGVIPVITAWIKGPPKHISFDTSGDLEIVSNYILSKMLITYGKPAQILINYPADISKLPGHPYDLLLFYPDLGILVDYFDDSEKEDGVFRLCPENAAIKLILWAPGEVLSLEEAYALDPGLTPETHKGTLEALYRPLEESTGMSINAFYEQFQDVKNHACLEVPAVAGTAPAMEQPVGVIFTWSYLSGYYVVGQDSNFGWGELLLPSQGGIPGPRKAIEVAFSHASQQVAYLMDMGAKDGKDLELWIADNRLQNPERVWSDENQWLGEVTDYGSAHLCWGIDDRYVILSGNDEPNEDHLVMLDRVAQTTYLWLGSCDTLAKSANSNRVVPICSVQAETGTTYFELGEDGVTQIGKAPASPVADTVLWRFSPDGKRVLYVTKDNQIAIANPDGSVLDLPVTFGVDYTYYEPGALNFQWSKDGKRVLVYGGEDNLCELSSWACWYVLDAQTGEFIWWPTGALAEADKDAPEGFLEHLGVEWNMALSPDGQWLAATLTDDRVGHWYAFVIISLADGSVRYVSEEAAYYLIWGE